MDAIDRTRIDALVTTGTEFGDDNHVEIVVEDRPEWLRAGPEAGITGDAHIHIDLQRRVLPQFFALARLKPTLPSAFSLLWFLFALYSRLGHQGQATGYALSVASYPFLSREWIDAARQLREEYAEQIPEAPVAAKVNLIVTEIPHGDQPTLEGHIDTNSGQTIIEEGHLEDPELTVTVDYATARAAFVTRDQQEVMQSFLTGKILVDGDASRLLALASGPPTDVDPVAIELYEKLDALTIKD